MTTVYTCDKCGLIMADQPSYSYGRCPECGHKLYPNGYSREAVSDDYAREMTKYYPAPSWEEDVK